MIDTAINRALIVPCIQFPSVIAAMMKSAANLIICVSGSLCFSWFLGIEVGRYQGVGLQGGAEGWTHTNARLELVAHHMKAA